MPHLLFFIACEKAIISQDEGDLTLVGVLDGLRLGSPSAPVKDEKISFPQNWNAVARWTKEAGDEGVNFEQRVQIIPPSGEATGQSVTRFSFSNRSGAVNITNGTTFPFFGVGTYFFRLSYRTVADSEDEAIWREISDYPFFLSTE